MITKKILVFILVFCILVLLRSVFRFITAFIRHESMNLTWKDEVINGVCLSYIITIISTGFCL